jgi:MoaA/NifB/PqqE/SkfB family radical SAM enzyme
MLSFLPGVAAFVGIGVENHESWYSQNVCNCERLFAIIEALRDKFPETRLHMLTNGRVFAWPGYTARLAAIRHPNLVLGIPLYSDDSTIHDYVVQAKGAFDQTVMGLHQLARYGLRIELRVVLHV